MKKPVKKMPTKQRDTKLAEEYRMEIRGLSSADLTGRANLLTSQVTATLTDQNELRKQIAVLNAKVRDSRNLQHELETRMMVTYETLRDHR